MNRQKILKQPVATAQLPSTYESPTSKRKSFPKAQPKKSIPPPSSFGGFALLVVLHACKRILLLRTDLKAALYFVGVAGISLFFDLFRPGSPPWFAAKTNLLNVVFVKWSWAWSSVILFAFIVCSAYVYTSASRQLLKRHVLRLLYATSWWFVCTKILMMITKMKTSYCMIKASVNRSEYNTSYTTGTQLGGDSISQRDCEKLGHQWVPGLDISGHVFILVLINLMAMEEAAAFRGWDRLAAHLADVERRHSHALPIESLSPALRAVPHELAHRMLAAHTLLTPLVRVLFVALALLSLVADWSLVLTAVYYHTMPSKVLGCLLALLFWLLTYCLLYRLRPPASATEPGAVQDTWLPCMPGSGCPIPDFGSRDTRVTQH